MFGGEISGKNKKGKEKTGTRHILWKTYNDTK